MTFNSKMTRIADAIREKTGETAPLTLDEMAESIENLPEGGATVDPDKIINATATGKRMVSVNDISEIPHNISIELSDSNATVTQYGKNLFDNSQYTSTTVNGITIDVEDNGIFHIHGTSTGGTPSTDWTAIQWEYPIKISEGQYYTASAKLIDGYTDQTVYPYFGTANALDGSRQNWISIAVSPSSSIGNVKSSTKLGTEMSADAKYISYFWFYFGTWSAGTSIDCRLQVWLEASKTTTAYEPYQKPIVQTQGDIKHMSPYTMLIADDDIDITIHYNKSWGMVAEHNAFWDAYQQNGNRTNYTYAFYGAGWTDENYNPKYPFAVTAANGMFQGSYITDTKVPIDFTDVGNNSQTFAWATRIVTIHKVIYAANVALDSNAFSGCSKLENITVDGFLGSNMKFSDCPLLTHDSLMSIINHLATVSETKTLTLGATNLAKLTDAEKTKATEKGWSLA